MSSLRVQSQKIKLVNPHISFDFWIVDIGIFKKKIDMNNNQCSKAERNDFEFDLLSGIVSKSIGSLFGGVRPEHSLNARTQLHRIV